MFLNIILALSCVACHIGRVGDEVIMGMPNRHLQLHAFFTDVKKLHPLRAPVMNLARSRFPTEPGIWASAPYLHNGSVPTLEDLFNPEEKRPIIWKADDEAYDYEKMGLKYESVSEIPDLESS